MSSSISRGAEVEHLTIDEALNKFDWNGRFYLQLSIFTGLTYMSDSLEINLLGFLSACAAEDMSFSGNQKIALTTAVFIGEFIGAVVWAIMADVLGRRKAGIMAMTVLSISSILTATAYSYNYLWCLRVLVGFGIGGSGIPLNTMGEFLPMNVRGTALAFGQVVWGVGAIATNALAWFILSGDSAPEKWRALTFWCSVFPTIALVGVVAFVPESPRWLLEKKEYMLAEKLVREAAVLNGNALKPFTFARQSLLPSEESPLLLDDARIDENPRTGFNIKGNDGLCSTIVSVFCKCYVLPRDLFLRIKDILWDGEMRNSTALLCIMWIVKGAWYYGSVLFMNRLYNISTEVSVCNFKYDSILISSTSEIVGALMVVPFLDSVGRVRSVIFANTVGMLALAIMMVDLSPHATTMGAWCMRLSTFASGVALFAITLESFNTKNRVSAFALFFFLSRAGAIASTIAVGNLAVSNVFLEGFFLLAAFVQTLAAIFLNETKGKPIDNKF